MREMRCHMGIHLLLCGRERRLDHPGPLSVFLTGLPQHDHLLIFRFPIVTQAVLLASLLLGCRASVIMIRI